MTRRPDLDRIPRRRTHPRARHALAAALAVALLAVMAIVAKHARADVSAIGPRLVLRAPGSAGAPLVLAPGEGGFVGTFEIVNEGGAPLVVSRIAVRGDEDEARVPPRVTVKLAGAGGTAITLPPGRTATVEVSWMPERASRVKQLFGHVIVTSNDEARGELAMGIHAFVRRGPAFVTEHILSLLTFLPLVGALLALGMHFARARDDRPLRVTALALTGLQCLLAAWLYTRFNGEVTRADGTDGLQFVEHAVWVRALHAEYYVGVDGISVPMVLMTSLVAFAGVVASFGRTRDVKGFFAAYLALVSGITGVFVAMDLLLFLAFWQVTLIAAYFLVGIWGGARRDAAASKLVLVTALGSALLLIAFVALYVHSDRGFLVDGSVAEHTWSIPELSRVSYGAKKLTFFGLPFVKVIWSFAFVGFAIVLPMFPFHTWLPDAYAAAPAPVSALLSSAFVAVGTYGILRVLLPILPEGTRWAAGAIVAFGVVNVIYGALCALAQDDLKRVIAYACVSHGGFCLIGIFAMTPQGIEGALVQAVTHGIIAAMLTFLVGALEDRVHTRSMARFGGLSAEVPIFGGLLAVGVLASLGLPGLAGFWGTALAIVGAFPSFKLLACAAALGLVLVAAVHVAVLRRVLFGAFPESWRKDAYLEPFGGHLPEISFRELASVAPLLVLIVLLGLWPAPLLRVVSGGVRDVTSFVNPPGPEQIAAAGSRGALASLR